MIRIANIDRNARTDRRNDGLIGKDSKARVCKFAHFAVSHRGDTLGDFRHKARVYRIDRVYIRKVLVHIGTNSRRKNRACDVASAARERGHLTLLRVAEESRIDGNSLEIRKRARERGIARRIKSCIAKRASKDHACILGAYVASLAAASGKCNSHDLGAVVFTGRFHEIDKFSALKLFHLGKAILEISLNRLNDLIAKLQLLRNFRVALYNCTKLTIRILAIESHFRKCNEKVCHLRILRVPLTGSGDNHDAPCGIGEDDIHHLVELRGVRKGTSAEFTNFHILSNVLLK